MFNLKFKDLIIDLVAPSFGCTTSPYKERLEKAIELCIKNGMTLYIGDNVYKKDGIVASNTPENRKNELIKAFSSNSNIVWSVGGGEMLIELLLSLDIKTIKKFKKKTFIGFSDNTYLIHILTTLNNTKNINHINFPSIAINEKYIHDLFDLLEGKNIFYGYDYFELNPTNDIFPKLNLDTKKIISTINYKEKFQGSLLGGTIDCLIHLIGTKFDNYKEYSKNKKIIWYLEACDLKPLEFRRSLIHFRLAGWFNNISGILIGRSRLYNETEFGLNYYDCVNDILTSLNVPILFNIDFSHLSPSIPFVSGAECIVSYENENIVLEYI